MDGMPAGLLRSLMGVAAAAAAVVAAAAAAAAVGCSGSEVVAHAAVGSAFYLRVG